jgi:hypothetical protein
MNKLFVLIRLTGLIRLFTLHIGLVTALLMGALLGSGCAHNPNKAEKISTQVEKTQDIAGGEQLGVKDGNMIVQKKVMMGEELRRLQTEVYELEDQIYGNRKYGSKGLYGVLKDCRMELSDKRYGGDGKLKWTEPMDRLTDKEPEFKIGYDEKDQLVGVTEEFLNDRIQRFKKYKTILQGRQDEIEEKIDICKTELKSQKHDIEKGEQ